MSIKKHYIINPNFMYMMSRYDREGHQCTQIIETDKTLLVSRSPLDILDDSIRCIGYSLEGAMETSKWLLDQSQMCPIMVNPLQEIVVFPIKSPYHDDNIWFNPYHIKRTTSNNQNTKALLSNGSFLVIPTRLTAFNSKLQAADQLKSMTQTGTTTFILIRGPRKKSKKKKSKKNESDME